jgi:hypothetical protein
MNNFKENPQGRKRELERAKENQTEHESNG